MFRLCWSDEPVCVCRDVVVFDRLFDPPHRASGVLAPGVSFRVMGMFGGGALQSCSVFFGMAGQAELLPGDEQIGDGVGMDLMAVETT